MTEQEVRRRFLSLIDRYGGSFKEAAPKLGYSAQYLGQIIAGQKRIPDPLLAEIGVKRKIVYEEAQ